MQADKTFKRSATSDLSQGTEQIWLRCAFRNALGSNADAMLSDAREAHGSAGEVIYETGDGSDPPFAVVTQGLVRVYAMSTVGRQATIRYPVAGDVIGLPLLLAPSIIGSGVSLAVQSLTECTFLNLSPERFRQIASADARCMWPLFSVLACSMMHGYHLLSHNVFQPVRARVARHMLDLSDKHGNLLVVQASQQDIADAIGSVREVVSRAIISLRDEAIIRRSDGVYVICDPARLHAAALDNSIAARAPASAVTPCGGISRFTASRPECAESSTEVRVTQTRSHLPNMLRFGKRAT
jgi:CRP-like cAMP-binding protein